MKLQSLDFRRDSDTSYDRNHNRVVTESFKGVARFDGADGSVSLVLSEAEAKQILSICSDSLERVLTAKANGMKAALQSALILNKNIEIGETLPASW